MKNKMFDLICLQKKNVWLYVSLEKKSLPFDAGRNKMFAQGGKNLAPPWISNGPPLSPFFLISYYFDLIAMYHSFLLGVHLFQLNHKIR